MLSISLAINFHLVTAKSSEVHYWNQLPAKLSKHTNISFDTSGEVGDTVEAGIHSRCSDTETVVHGVC